MQSIFPDGELEEAVEVGAVDDRSVRVWLRRPGATEVHGGLEVEGRPPVDGMARLSAETDWTGALVLSLPAPAPGAAFVCTVGDRRLAGRLAAALASHAGVCFGFGSCHKPFIARADGSVGISARAGIYPAMTAELLRNDARFMLLIGDQMYSDALPAISVSAALDGDARPSPSPEQALAAYRRVYRGFFGQAGGRALRESLPAYCVWDDHEIRDDWGSAGQRSPLDQVLFEAACRSYCEYQHQRNPGGGIGPPPYHYTFRHGDIGFFILDLRGARDARRRQVLGAEQWAAVRDYLAGEEARTLQTLFVVASVPLGHVSRWAVVAAERLPGEAAMEVRDRWSSSAFVGERDALLDELFGWQTGSPERQVILLSGDVHAASGFTIRRRGAPGVIRQFTSSAFITPLHGTERLMNSVAVRAPNLLEPRLRFERHLLAWENNYGFVRVSPLARGGHRVEFTVRAWQTDTRSLRTKGRLVCAPDDD